MNHSLKTSSQVALLVGAIACGCGPERELQELRQEIASLRQEIAVSKERDVSMLARQLLEGKERFHERYAVLDCASSGFTPVREYPGSPRAGPIFLISCDDATPYLNGHKLTLRLGNPQMAGYDGVTLRAIWGRAAPERIDILGWDGRFSPGFGQRAESLTQALPPGSWTTSAFQIPAAQPEDFAFLAVAVETSEVRLVR